MAGWCAGLWGYWEGIAARFALVVGEMAGLGEIGQGMGLEMGYRGIGGDEATGAGGGAFYPFCCKNKFGAGGIIINY